MRNASVNGATCFSNFWSLLKEEQNRKAKKTSLTFFQGELEMDRYLNSFLGLTVAEYLLIRFKESLIKSQRLGFGIEGTDDTEQGNM